MAEYSSRLIYNLIKDIEEDKVILPAMQRNFVWPEDKVCNLFDSLMRNYPIGTFLFWNIKKDDVQKYVFNKFIRKYDEQKGNLQRGDKVEPTRDEYEGVLDGQQRITSLYIGLRGEYRTHIKGRHWEDSTAYINRYLCLDIMHKSDDDKGYNFAFMDEENIRKKLDTDEVGTRCKFWIKVADIYEAAKTNPEQFDPASFMDVIIEKYFPEDELTHAETKNARITVKTLSDAIFTKKNVNFYPAENKSLTQVVDIFVRVNSGGQKLSASDLMLSVATGEQGNTDIHKQMQEALDKINDSTSADTGFIADKELILTAGLFFTGAESLSLQKKENYERDRINAIMDKWDEIIEALCNASQYIEYLGFNGRKLTSKNLLLPIAYYFYANSLGTTHKNSTKERAKRDRIFIRQWLLRAMINSIFRDGTGSTLIRIRNVMIRSKHDYFPLDDLIKASTTRPLIISNETIDEMLGYKYGDVRIAPLLMEISRANSGIKYDVDHIWPKSKLMSKRELNNLLPTLSEADKAQFKENCHYLANLELLETQANEEKLDRLYKEWVEATYPDRTNQYYEQNCIPQDVDYDFDKFIEFSKKRKELLKKKIKKALPEDFNAILDRYQLSK
jgi:uncharacterized protein with ParB-like and HNH nuclease domain